jgi:hypothetical protein
MGLRFTLFKTPQHKRFEYTPRIWDPAREEREERLKRIRAEMGYIGSASDGKPYVPNLKGRFRKEHAESRARNPMSGYNRIRQFVIVGIVILLCAIFFYIVKIYPYLFPDDASRNTNTTEQTDFYE